MPPPVPRKNPNTQRLTQEFITVQENEMEANDANKVRSFYILLNKIIATIFSKKNILIGDRSKTRLQKPNNCYEDALYHSDIGATNSSP